MTTAIVAWILRACGIGLMFGFIFWTPWWAPAIVIPVAILLILDSLMRIAASLGRR